MDRYENLKFNIIYTYIYILGVRREIKLAKQWDLYDLATEFMSDEGKDYYPQPSTPRPKKDQNVVVEDEDIILSD